MIHETVLTFIVNHLLTILQ